MGVQRILYGRTELITTEVREQEPSRDEYIPQDFSDVPNVKQQLELLARYRATWAADIEYADESKVSVDRYGTA